MSKVIKLHERRGLRIQAIIKTKERLEKLKNMVHELDSRILEICNHPKEYQKIVAFEETEENEGVWMCSICHQVLRTSDYNKQKELTFKEDIHDAEVFMHELMGINPNENTDNREHRDRQDDPGQNNL